MAADEQGSLYIVSTPIGNLGDMTFRAVEVLSSAALVIAEDTRHSRRLLDHYGIRTPVAAYHEHNEAKETPRLVQRLLDGDSVALISDAGTPLVSDPGARLVAAAAAAGIPLVPVPGPSALLAALAASGLPAERFTFFGFLPRKGRERKAAVADIASLRHTAVLYEAPGRVGATLADLDHAGLGERRSVVARELTKKFEQLVRGTVAELARMYAEVPPRGEITLLIEGGEAAVVSEESLRAAARQLREAGMAPRDVVDRLVSEHGAARNLAYRLVHEP